MKEITDLSIIKERELHILKAFDHYCKENGLTYYIAYGTLLGAVRHKGFIPWDDDIDVWMLRDDYNKLIRHYRDNRYRLMSVERCKRNEYTYAHAKIIDSQTLLIEEVRPQYELGIYIDIFPLDYLKNNDEYHDKLIKRYNRINYYHKAKGIKGNILKIIGRKGWSRIYNILHVFNKYKYSHIGNCCSVIATKDYYERNWFNETVKLHFEDSKFEAPIEYKKVLKERYGNYMSLPEKKKQERRHDFKVYIR